MPKVPANQNPDARQGGEGTQSLHNRQYDALVKDIGSPPGSNTRGLPPKDEGTK